MEISYLKVKSKKEIEIVSNMAYTLFPIDYSSYISEEHVKMYLDENQSVEAIQKQINQKRVYFLIQQKKEWVGYIALDFSEKIVNLNKFYMQVSKRGQGIGEKVIQWVDLYLRKKNYTEIELVVLKDNEKAIRFYEKTGFEIKGEFLYTFSNGTGEKHYRMRKSIVN